ncbi:related to ARK1-Actin Regulating Kinase [Sporisorium reilianum SRZ2]|uniref:non-specific serine/threonine protein kinase n=1 Tax=Sporisorium reilianum (strain SRZ2) TaxID=999809 RepID=E7A1X6_SPORE|nr:related to ARK1-Actin Regulating Kinase [Sporisorium reilianum SRZ2]
MSQYGQAYQANAYPHAGHQRMSTPQSGYQMQQQQQQPSMAAAYQQPYKGTLAPGTRVKVGNITVTVKRYLSEGGFAHVYLVTTAQPIPMPSSVTGAVSASMANNSATAERGETVHVLKRMAVPDKAALADVRREVEVHKLLRNQANIVHFIEASATSLQGGGYEIFILMEYCSGGGIISLMNARLRDRLREEEVLKIFGDVCAGVAVMHHLDPPLMHRDLKVENILMAPSTDPGTIPGSRSTSSNLKATFKLCDFGSAAPVLSRKPAKSMDEVKRVEADLNKHTTLQYRAPEMVDVYQRRVIDEKADIWALGVLLYKLCYYTTPFEENGGGPLAILNVQYRIPPQPVYSDRLKQLIHSMLKEQSTDRPTVDQVILNVHQILGTRPPQAAVHYAQAAASGKIAAPLPTLVSGGSKTLSASDAASSSPAKSKPTGGIDANLISMGPSKKELEQAEARQLELQAQSITPMRRGRPTKSSAETVDSPAKKLDEGLLKSSSPPAPSASEAPAKSTPLWKVPDAKPSSVKTRPLIEGFGDSFAPAPTSAGPESPPVLPKRPTPSSVSPEASGNAVGASERAIDKNLLRASSASTAPSPALSPLRHSPALPGFSVAPSPAASPLPVSSTAKDAPPAAPAPAQKSGGTPRDELTDRFPSLEELDARYATPAASSSPSSSAPASAPSSLPSAGAGGQVSVPGLANRASVGAMAGRFERPFEPQPQRPGSGRTAFSKSATISAFSGMGDSASRARSGSVSNRWQPSVIAHDRVGKEHEPKMSGASSSLRKTPASKDWLTGDVSDQEEEQRTEAAGAAQPRAASRSPSAAQRGAAQEVEADDASSDDDEPAEPEEAVAQRPALPPRLSADRLSSFTGAAGRPAHAAPMQADEDGANGKTSRPERPRITPGRVKAPSWLVDAVDSPTAAERLMSTSQGASAGYGGLKSPGAAAELLVSPVTDATAAEQLDEAARRAQHQLEALLRGPAEDEEPGPVLASVAKVKAPAWDDDVGEDVREMKALPKPDILAGMGKAANGQKPSPPPVLPATSKPASSSLSTMGSRSDSQPDPSQLQPQLQEKQLVDVAASPATVDTVKDKLSAISLTAPEQPAAVSSGPAKPSTLAAQRGAHDVAEPAVMQPKRPTPIRPPKSAHLRSGSSSTAGGLKPWEREAAQSAAASKNGVVKSSALPAASTMRLHAVDDADRGAGGAGEEDRFSGVSSLISRWQQNVESNAPGWGRIGGKARAGAGSRVASQAAQSRDRFAASGAQ